MNARRAMRLSAAIIAGLAGGVCVGAEPPSRQQVIEAATKALSAGDVDKAYALMLPLAEAGDAEIQFSCAFLFLNYWFTTMPHDAQQAQGMGWLRKAAHQGWDKALRGLADTYEWGWSGVLPDKELAACYRDATSKLSAVARCVELERAKGYLGRR